MGQVVPAAIEQYLVSLNRRIDPVLEAIERQGRELGLPIVGPEVGLLLRTLAAAVAARRILEIGTAIGYSGTWLARALAPDGMLITIETDAALAAKARTNFERAGVADRASVMIGDAARVLAKLAGPFDLIFNDGDKRLYGPLHDRLVALLRPGGLLAVDNVLWNGEVVPGFAGARQRPADVAAALAAYNERLASDARLLASFLPLRDGVAVAVRLAA